LFEHGLPDSAIEAAASVKQWLSSPLSKVTSSLIASLSCRSSIETWSRSQANDAIASDSTVTDLARRRGSSSRRRTRPAAPIRAMGASNPPLDQAAVDPDADRYHAMDKPYAVELLLRF
jgi:hypothetical protein